VFRSRGGSWFLRAGGLETTRRSSVVLYSSSCSLNRMVRGPCSLMSNRTFASRRLGLRHPELRAGSRVSPWANRFVAFFVSIGIAVPFPSASKRPTYSATALLSIRLTTISIMSTRSFTKLEGLFDEAIPVYSVALASVERPQIPPVLEPRHAYHAFNPSPHTPAY